MTTFELLSYGRRLSPKVGDEVIVSASEDRDQGPLFARITRVLSQKVEIEMTGPEWVGFDRQKVWLDEIEKVVR